ncbi:uncharacterized protein LOC142348173 isoform X2 [Convolutriloba macropyga]|uniref:uncharacterized protein LOC142348173 isoform X2 n=1 Tax=Convolutriloba macropyga TaxID=536237 RepID=UPI003F51E96A
MFLVCQILVVLVFNNDFILAVKFLEKFGRTQKQRKLPTTALITRGINSPVRSFYARLQINENNFCGASILSERFVATSAECVVIPVVHAGIPLEDLRLDVGDFSRNDSTLEAYEIEDFVLVPTNTTTSSRMSTTALATCGMGSFSSAKDVELYPDRLQETLLYQTTFYTISSFSGPVVCPEGMVCTTPVFEGGSICAMDEGGPLYKMSCYNMEPACLYGIASHYSSIQRSNKSYTCNGSSYFASIIYYREWILDQILRKP